jgi:hypothetical protein
MVRLPARVRDFSLKASRRALSPHVGVVYLESKAAGACFCSFFSTSAEVKNEWGCTSAKSVCLHDVYRQNISFLDA